MAPAREMEDGEWGDLDAKLERKKRVKLRQQQRELKKQMKDMEAREKERRRLVLRCEEMAREDELSVAMMRFYEHFEMEEQRAKRLEKDLLMYGETAAVRKKAKDLGVDIHTPGLVREERLAALRSSVENREDAIKQASEARERLEIMSKTRSRMIGLMEVYCAAATRRKVEKAVRHLRCEALIPLLDREIEGKRGEPTLLNLESRNGLTPAICLILRRQLAYLRRVLELGASPDWETREGATPLLAAVLMDDIVALDILVSCKVTVDRANQAGVKALHFAVAKGKTELVKALIRHGADINGTITNGRTALMQAARFRQYGAAQVLIAFAAKKDVVDKDEKSALHIARQHGAHQIATLLTSPMEPTNLLAILEEKEREEADIPEAVRRCIRRRCLVDAEELELALKQRNIARLFRFPSEEEQNATSLTHKSCPEELKRGNSDGNDDHIDGGSCQGSAQSASEKNSRDSSSLARQWGIRRDVLRRNIKRNMDFENERLKIWKYAQRGRRNGLIAPLPNDPAGRLKFPPCDNCQASRARKRCYMCEQVQCDKCHARLHEIPHRAHHEYAEIDPVFSCGTIPLEDMRKSEEKRLPAAINRSMAIVESMKRMLEPTCTSGLIASGLIAEDIEITKYNRKQRIAREKEIAHAPIHVPTAAVKHAAKQGDHELFLSPSEIHLTDLYITQNKLNKARGVIEKALKLAEESLGPMHPTMLKVQVRLARIEQHEGDIESSLKRIEATVPSFEAILPVDDDDLILAQDLLLELLDLLARYQDGVQQSCQMLELRMSQLGPVHKLCEQSRRQIDSFTAKRELKAMYDEDVLVQEQEATITGQEQRRQEARQRHLRGFRLLLLDQSPPEAYEAFVNYAKKEFADELLQFWIAAEKARTMIPDSEARMFRATAVSIYLTFIKSRRIKLITAVQRKKIKKTITTPGKPVPRSIYDEIQATVFDVIYNGVYARYEPGVNSEGLRI